MFENGRIFLSLVPKFGSANEQPYKYNAKEFDSMHGLNWYDYAARMYDPTSSRFTSIDPLAEKYYSESPYIYVSNNPIKYIDPDGRERLNGIEHLGWLTLTANYKHIQKFRIID